MKTLAKYQCTKCQYIFQTIPQPVECIRCGNVYVKWLNYSEMFERRKENSTDGP